MNKISDGSPWRCCLGGIRYKETESFVKGNLVFLSFPYEIIKCVCHLKPKLIEHKKQVFKEDQSVKIEITPGVKIK